MNDKCVGAGQLPRIYIENDWWVGLTAVCAACGRSFRVKSNQSKTPTHKARKAVAA